MFRRVLLLLAPSIAMAADYNVGPGQTHANIGDVPWESLNPGDNVLIHGREEPYREKWVMARSGTEQAPITVRGVDGPNGPPVINGANATTREALDYWSETRGIIKVGGSSIPDQEATHIVIENLRLTGARGSFTDEGGAADTYDDNASAIFVESGNHITIRDCEMSDSGNGLFVAFAAANVVIEGNDIFSNGNVGSIYEHNSYTEAQGITFQYNRYGPLCEGCEGNNLKDRSSGSIIRYNWIESGNRQLDLVDSDHTELLDDPAYDHTFVYGNILIEPDGAGNSQVVHFGGDNDEAAYRPTLYFFHNTVLSTRNGNTTIMRLSSAAQVAHVFNNIFYVTANGTSLAMTNVDGDIFYRNNWFNTDWRDSHSGATGTLTDEGGNIDGAEPGFADVVTQNFHLMQNSPCVNAGSSVNTGTEAHPVEREYASRSGVSRPLDSQPDLGAYELDAEGPDGGIASSSSSSTGTSSASTSSSTAASTSSSSSASTSSSSASSSSTGAASASGDDDNATDASGCTCDGTRPESVGVWLAVLMLGRFFRRQSR